MVHNDGFSITELLIDSVCSALDISSKKLQQRFTGGCFDGQYIHLNVRKHFSQALSLSLEFMNDANTHDAAHRLELAKCDWLIELDDVPQHIMTHFRFGHNHTELPNIAQERNQVFLEFNLFLETRFVEYCQNV